MFLLQVNLHILFIIHLLPGSVAHACDPSTREAKEGGSLQVCGQLGLQNEFKADLNGLPQKTLTLVKPSLNTLADTLLCYILLQHIIVYNSLPHSQTSSLVFVDMKKNKFKLT